jgi:hypothetical protein
MLLETRGIGAKTLSAILRRNAVARRTPAEFLSLSAQEWTEEYGIRKASAARLMAEVRRKRESAELTARWLAKSGVSLITLLDASYPARLSERLDDPPPALFAYGRLPLLNAALFAAANSNDAPEEALAAVDAACETAIAAGWTLVTGHNRPAFQRPALTARRNGGSVVYVLDRGLLHGFGGDLTRALFPAARIWGPAFDPTVDLAISPFPLRAQGIAAANRLRDSVLFALPDRIFAAYLKPHGQMERQCLAALGRSQRVLEHTEFITESLCRAGAESANLREAISVKQFLSA